MNFALRTSCGSIMLQCYHAADTRGSIRGRDSIDRCIVRGVDVRPREILIMIGMFVLFFVGSEIIVTSLVFSSEIQRFVLRIALLVQYGALIHLLFRTDKPD